MSNAKNRIILGVMTFGPDDGGASHAKVHSLQDYGACLDAFAKAGYNEIDTARSYCSGKQEAFTAKVGYKKRGLTIATKCYPIKAGDHKAENLLATMATSLQELDTGSVDIFYLHAADRTTPFQETLEAINLAYTQKKFKTFAISNFTAAEVAEVCMICKYNGWVKPTLYQGAYNVINRTPEYDLLPTLRRHGLDWVVYNPLAGGMLTGRFLSKDDKKSGRFAGEGVAELYAKRYWKDDTFAALNLINDAAREAGLSMTEVALRWIQHHSALNMRTAGGNDGKFPVLRFRYVMARLTCRCTGIIIGASSLSQLQENLHHLEQGRLPDAVVLACEAAWEAMAGSRPPYYHGEYVYKYDTLEALYGVDAK